jgi:predicted RNA-binding protein YlqC (UPF0109 family)
MRELIEYVADWIVDDPDAVRVTERDRGDRVVVQLEVAQDDMGRVIGKNGRIANAMRTLLKVSGDVRDRHTALEIR